MAQMVFKRYEKKYIITEEQFKAFTEKTSHRLKTDQYGKHTICNIYFDTDNYSLIRESIAKPVYKEKLRLRSYGIPTAGSRVFLEIKKKFKGVVYKRRVAMTLDEAYDYIYNRNCPEQSQILSEIDYFMDFYNPHPKVYLAYDRIAKFDELDENTRVTFDTNVRWRDGDIGLENGDDGDVMFGNGKYIMEIKIADAMPLWLADVLDELKIYPMSYSKYGNCYLNYLSKNIHSKKIKIKGEKNCA